MATLITSGAKLLRLVQQQYRVGQMNEFLYISAFSHNINIMDMHIGALTVIKFMDDMF